LRVLTWNIRAGGGARLPRIAEALAASHRGNGFRIDHAFASARLARSIGDIRYSHVERLGGLSDRSALLVEMARGPGLINPGAGG